MKKSSHPKSDYRVLTFFCLTLAIAAIISTAASLAAPAKSAATQASKPASVAAPAAPIANDHYSLYQTSAVLGDKDVLVSSEALKVTDRKNGIGLIAHAPDWTVHILMPRSRRICSYPYNKYSGTNKDVTAITGGINLNILPLKRAAKTTVNGIAAVGCETNKAFESKQLKELERGFAGPRFAKYGELIIADGGPLDKLPRQAKIILSRFYGIPEFAGQGFPLRFKYVDLTDQLHTLLLTNEFKALKSTGDAFALPTDFTQVSDISKLDDRPKSTDKGPSKPIEILKKGRYH
ncbi:MAG: hypothetical protein KGS72_08675 [Cyanobacteria bacterium REEB67]|nr:hypothetical protein [Cyanobacteria bacterium REEB67]